jgi:DNA repair protein RecN (Recombination protein N)
MTSLQSIRFQHFLLFEDAFFEPGSGLTILSGESGAGKSLFLEGLQLLFGARAENALVQGLQQKAILEAVFNIPQRHDIALFLEANELEKEEELLIRRELAPTGKTRCFINDTPVSVQQLKELSSLLLELHSQHETGLVRNLSYQLDLLDNLAHSHACLQSYKEVYSANLKLRKELSQVIELQAKSAKDQDYLIFLSKELIEAKLEDIDEVTLTNEQELLANASEIVSISQKLQHVLEGEDVSLSILASELRNGLRSLQSLSTSFSHDLTQFESAWLELKEVTKEVIKKGENITYDPERLAYVEQKLQVLQTLKRKHQVESVAELMVLRDNLINQSQQFSGLESKIETLMQEIKHSEDELQKLAENLSSLRTNAALSIEKELMQILKSLEMPHASFSISVVKEKREKWNLQGPNLVSFLFSANPGIEPKPMEQVASGGELSRLMLGFKYLSRQNEKLLVFDEIDTGVSGEVARKMGAMLHKMGKSTQLIVISHLPQVASKGDTHYLISKEQTATAACSFIKKLDNEARIFEIGRLLSGKVPGEKALKNAEELLAMANES